MPRHSKQVPISSNNNRAARSAHARARQEFKTYDTTPIRPKVSKAPVIALVVILVSVVVMIVVITRSCAYEPEMLPSTQEAVVTVAQGEGARDIADTLLEERLIGNSQRFVDLVQSRGVASSLIPGTYQFRGGTSMDEILDVLLIGPQATADTLTVPEGMTRQNIANEVESATSGRITSQEFMDATANASTYSYAYPFLDSAGENSLEGYLFPKTYAITAKDDATSVVYMMLNRFRDEAAGVDTSYPQSLGMSWYDIVKLASIVQKEGIPENFATVAGVFYNRLNSNSPYLQSDATTAYEVGHDPTADEVHADSPYSTYSNAGLPPTPICNPSLEAIKAVCSPEETDYMYFYSYEDGTFKFSETYEDHQTAWQ